MLTIFFLSMLSAAGLVTAWSRTGLKLHLLHIFPGFRGVDAETADAYLLSKGMFGELLNCSYCLSAWVGLIFFSLYTFLLPSEVALLLSSFFGMPAVIALLNKSPQYTATVEYEATAETETATPPENSDKQLEKIVKDPEAHRRLAFANKELFAALVSPERCDFPGCQDLVHSYQKELEELEKEAASKGEACPDCVKGRLVTKYFYLLLQKKNENDTSTKA
jgi:hypothetical protein